MTKNERTFDFTETIVSESSLCHGKILKYKKKDYKVELFKGSLANLMAKTPLCLL